MTLEQELAQLRAKLIELDERVRLQRVAETFPESPILAGDHYVTELGVGTCVREETENRKGIWSDRNGTWESRNGPNNPERLYTRAEVLAILAIRTPVTDSQSGSG